MLLYCFGGGLIGRRNVSPAAASAERAAGRTIARLEAAGRGEPDPIRDEPEGEDAVHSMNEVIRDRHAGRPAAELVDAYTESYDRLIRAIDALPESALTDSNAFPWSEGQPLIEISFTGHLHEEHVPAVRAWLRDR